VNPVAEPLVHGPVLINLELLLLNSFQRPNHSQTITLNLHIILFAFDYAVIRMGLKFCMGDKTRRYHKHTKFGQNPSEFLVDLTWNDPMVIA